MCRVRSNSLPLVIFRNYFSPIQFQSIIRTENLLTFCKPTSLPFIVRKTLGLRVYVSSISNEFYFT